MEYQNNSKGNIIRAITEQPLKGLESKITNIKNDIQTRRELNDKILSELLTQKIQLKDKLNRVNYQSTLAGSSIPNTETSAKLTELQNSIIKEKLSCFREISEFQKKFQETQNDLEMEKLSQRLL